MNSGNNARPVDILLVEDNPGDANLTREVMENHKASNKLHVVDDGVEAMDFLRRKGRYANSPRPDLVLLDLNLPRKNGKEVLAEMKSDDDLKRIPVVVLTISRDEGDILKSYNLHANCFITKPIDLSQFAKVVEGIDSYWFSISQLPPKGSTP